MSPKVRDQVVEDGIDRLLDIVAVNVSALMQELTQQELAKRTGLGKGTIQRVLGGAKGYGGQKKSAAQIDTLFRIAWYFEIPFTQLFSQRDKTNVVLGMSRYSTADVDEVTGRRHLKSRRS